MRQLIQMIKTGESLVVDIPAPIVRPNGVLIQTRASLVSAGTERMVVDFAEKNLLQKARLRPDLVREIWEKAQREGIMATVEAVQNRLDQPMTLGYSSAGVVIAVGSGVSDLAIGDHVACAGGGHAVHAEIAAIPKNLVVKLPAGVVFEAAAFTTVGAIALQGIRLAEVRLGEVVAVIGLGLLGQLTVQMLKASGCLVIGMDIQPQRAELARQLGTDVVATSNEELSAACLRLSNGYGVDSVFITADTKSNQPVEVAGEIVRDKGIVVAVGAVGMELPRKIYYEKELDFRISRSYGPGRYDLAYEEEGHDYPYAYVRWTEQRNMQAFVQLLAERKIDLQPLITHRFDIAQAPQAYEVIAGKTKEPFLGVVVTYPEGASLHRKVLMRQGQSNGLLPDNPVKAQMAQIQLGVLGAGNFANATLLPAIKSLSAIKLVGIASGSGVTARTTADRFGFDYCTSEAQTILADAAINTVAILTRHHLHARQVMAALESGKHVFVEKPLCLNETELDAIMRTYRQASEAALTAQRPVPLLMVGFNRRFAPFIIALKQALQSVQEPLMLHYRVNAGFIPPNHWTQDPEQGGGRLRGEVCHFIDLLLYLMNKPLHQVKTQALPDHGHYCRDNLLLTLEFVDGSLGTITYVANGAKSFGKETIEVFGGGLAARLDDYRTLEIRQGTKRIKHVARLRADKGHQAAWKAIVAFLAGKGASPLSIEEVVYSTRATLAAYASLQDHQSVILE